jgi:hypothetical protein
MSRAARLLAGLPINCYGFRMAVKFRKRRAPRVAAVPPRVTVDPSGDWRACTDMLPKGCTVMGTVSMGANTGALVQLVDSGNLVMVRAGVIGMLNQRQVRQLLEAAERQEAATEMLPADLWRTRET